MNKEMVEYFLYVIAGLVVSILAGLAIIYLVNFLSK